MYRLETTDGELVTACEHIKNALSLLRVIPRASRVVTLDGVVLARREFRDFMKLATWGQDAGSPRGLQNAWLAS